MRRSLTHLHFGWNSVTDDQTPPAGLTCNIRAGPTPTPPTPWDSGAFVVSPAGTPASEIHDTVADLEFTPGVTVRLRVKARNAAGTSGPSPVVSVPVPVAAAA